MFFEDDGAPIIIQLRTMGEFCIGGNITYWIENKAGAGLRDLPYKYERVSRKWTLILYPSVCISPRNLWQRWIPHNNSCLMIQKLLPHPHPTFLLGAIEQEFPFYFSYRGVLDSPIFCKKTNIILALRPTNRTALRRWAQILGGCVRSMDVVTLGVGVVRFCMTRP